VSDPDQPPEPPAPGPTPPEQEQKPSAPDLAPEQAESEPPCLTPEQEQQLKHLSPEAEQWKSIEDLIQLIETTLHCSRGYAQKLWIDARASREVRYMNAHVDGIVFPAAGVADPDPRYDWVGRADDLKGWLDRYAPQAPPPKQKKRRTRYKQNRAERALKALFPDGPPDQTELSNDILCQRVTDWLKTDCKEQSIPWIDNISRKTILRAAGRE
jgi:hypothetical protein